MILLTCPLCLFPRPIVADSLTGEEIRALWLAHGDEVSEEAMAPVLPSGAVHRYRCPACGFQFFDPDLVGRAPFYEALSRPGYYTKASADFRKTIDFAVRKGLHRVLDIGCGPGNFLDLARDAGLETSGMELNPTAAATARSRGHKISEKDLYESVSAEGAGAFDLVTLFQVLEHVPNPARFLGAARKHVRPGGYLAVGVPFADGIHRLAPFIPHQWPPHHLTWWRFADLVRVGERTGLEVIWQGAERLDGSQIRYYLTLNARMGRTIGRRVVCPPNLPVNILTRLYTLFLMKFLLPRMGVSALTIFRRIDS
jgi:SAM-dependent methyltransferase